MKTICVPAICEGGGVAEIDAPEHETPGTELPKKLESVVAVESFALSAGMFHAASSVLRIE